VPRFEIPGEDEIRALVARIVDVMQEGPAAEAPSGPAIEVSDALESAIAVGADHGGFRLKERIAFRLREQGHQVVDCGTDSPDGEDYPDLALAVAEKVSSGECR